MDGQLYYSKPHKNLQAKFMKFVTISMWVRITRCCTLKVYVSLYTPAAPGSVEKAAMMDPRCVVTGRLAGCKEDLSGHAVVKIPETWNSAGLR
jgi:hypothetical protein